MRPSHRPARAGGGRRWIAPALLAVGALVATALTLVSAGTLPASVVDGLARAVGGCDSLLEVDRSGTIVVFSEERGGAVDAVGSCGAMAPGERDQVEVGSVVIADASGQALEIDDRDRGSTVTVGAWRATVIGRVEVEPGPYLVRVEGDGVVALGLDPREVESRRQGTAVAVLIGGLALAALVAVSSRASAASRRSDASERPVISVWDPPSGPRLG